MSNTIIKKHIYQCHLGKITPINNSHLWDDLKYTVGVEK